MHISKCTQQIFIHFSLIDRSSHDEGFNRDFDIYDGNFCLQMVAIGFKAIIILIIGCHCFKIVVIVFIIL